jgi:hypothetical protein
VETSVGKRRAEEKLGSEMCVSGTDAGAAAEGGGVSVEDIFPFNTYFSDAPQLPLFTG